MRTFLTVFWGVDAAGALVRVEYFDSAQPQNAWVKVLVTDEGARVRAVCLYGVQDEAKTDSQSAEFASAVEDAQAWLGQCPESVELEGVTLVPVSTSVFSYDGNDSRLLQVSSDGSGSSLTYGAAGFVSSVASWGSAEDSAVSFSLLCASTDGRVLAAGGASAGVPEFGVPSTGAHAGAGAGAGSVAGFDASVMHPLVWDENSFVPRVLGVGGSSVPSVGSLVPGAGSGAGLLDPYGWDSLGVAAPALPSAQGATGGAPVLPDSLVGVSAASGVVLGSTGFEVLGARVVDSRVARFTAPDPLAAPVGAGWGADPFSLVGGNPVSLVDPWGLSPVSVEDFEKQSRPSGIAGWVRNNWEYVAGGAMVIAGAVIGAVGAGLGPLGGAAFGAVSGALMGAGMSVIEQKASGGKVDWSKAGKEALKGAITGAVTGLVTGGLGNLKNLADGAAKISKVTDMAAKFPKLTKMKQTASAMVSKIPAAVSRASSAVSKAATAFPRVSAAVSRVSAAASRATTSVKSALTPHAHKFGEVLNKYKIVEDTTKETITGGINNVVSYYMDDTVKDKNPIAALGMFASGAGTSMVTSHANWGLKAGCHVKGYEIKIDPAVAAKQSQKVQEKIQEKVQNKLQEKLKSGFAKTGNIILESAIDASTGAMKNAVQYRVEAGIKGQEYLDSNMDEKLATGWAKDFAKSAVKGAVKMDSEKAGAYRASAANASRQVAESTLQGASKARDKISDGLDRYAEFYEKVKDLNNIDVGRWDRLK